MKTNIFNKESEKRKYVSPILESIKLDNEISLILVSNTFNSLPGDPNWDCTGTDNSQDQNSGSPWE